MRLPLSYVLMLDHGDVIDASRKGGLMRFVNHSCSPNCKMEKWSIAGEERCGIFAHQVIKPDEEVTVDYNIDFLHDHVRSYSVLRVESV